MFAVRAPGTMNGEDGPCLLGPISTDETARVRAAAVANAIATDRDAELLLTESVDVGESTEAMLPLPSSHRDSHSIGATLLETSNTIQPIVNEQDPSVLVMERASGTTFFSDLRASMAERLAAETDVLTVDGRGAVEPIASILVPVAGGRHSKLAVEAATAIAAANDAAIDLFHVVEDGSESGRQRGQQILDRASEGLEYEESDTWLYEASSAADAITEQSTYYDLTVMGAPTVSPLERFVFGSTATDVQDDADAPIVVAHAQQP
ncbi:MAG: universal stress protein UspA related nucleotide-binding protein [Halonotius sp. J07HN6]|nr:MAG: universal stress protein UspA related nucleotide-binding protein [Halonotius sp. J07HN6]